MDDPRLVHIHYRKGRQNGPRKEHLPGVLAGSALRVWTPGEKPPAQGVYWLVGVAFWASVDWPMLEKVNTRLVTRGLPDIVSVFDMDINGDTVEEHVPEMELTGLTPSAGLWVDGVFQKKAYSGGATNLICDFYDIAIDSMGYAYIKRDAEPSAGDGASEP